MDRIEGAVPKETSNVKGLIITGIIERFHSVCVEKRKSYAN